MEFFCSPAKLKALLEELKKHPNLSYHALNAKGDEYTNNHTVGRVNAVTWGCFPGREIVQPTVVDAATFGIWKVRAQAAEAELAWPSGRCEDRHDPYSYPSDWPIS